MEDIIEFQYIKGTFLYILPYLPVTLMLTFGSMGIGIVFGLAGAMAILKRIPVLHQLVSAVVLISRSLPSLILLYVIYYALPLVFFAAEQKYGIHIPYENMSPEWVAIIGLGIHVGAYLEEVFRAAVLSVPKGQMEAALTQGMSWYQGFFRIVLPQSVLFALPNVANQFLGLLKVTSVVFVITVTDLFGAAKIYTVSNYRYFEAFLTVGLTYWALGMIFEYLFYQGERAAAKYIRM